MPANPSYSPKATPTLGADPELFLLNNNGEHVPVCGLVGGTKDKPVPLPSCGPGFFVQEDNVMLEFNIPPARDAYAFLVSIDSAKTACLRLASEGYAKSLSPPVKGARIVGYSNSPEHLFSADKLSHPNAQMFGCAPEFDAYSNGMRVPPIDRRGLVGTTMGGAAGEWRTCGGHVHMGYVDCLPFRVPEYVVARFADVALALRFAGYDTQTVRRTSYGSPGRFRPRPYGIEYRTLSNFWVTNSRFIELVAVHGFALLSWLRNSPEPTIRRVYNEIPWDAVRDAIISGDSGLATQVLSYVGGDLGFCNNEMEV